jgi:hypothetical protein
MCDFGERLIAWMDRELTESEAVGVQRHLQDCAECRGSLAAYKEADKAFNAYCDEAMESATRASVPGWVPVVSVAAAAAALFLIFFRGHDRLPVHAPAATSAAVLEAPPAPVSRPVERIRRRHGVTPERSHNRNWVPAVPTIEIAIPAEAMFPPGAVPEGVTLTAEFSIAADGSAQQIRLRP